MANKKVKKTTKAKSNKNKEAENMLANQPWISMRSGLIIIAITSIGMAVLTAIQVIQGGNSVWTGVLYGLLFGGLIWAIFFGYYLFRRFLGPKG